MTGFELCSSILRAGVGGHFLWREERRSCELVTTCFGGLGCSLGCSGVCWERSAGAHVLSTLRLGLQVGMLCWKTFLVKGRRCCNHRQVGSYLRNLQLLTRIWGCYIRTFVNFALFLGMTLCSIFLLNLCLRFCNMADSNLGVLCQDFRNHVNLPHGSWHVSVGP